MKRRRKRYQTPGTTPGTLTAHAEAGGVPTRIDAFLYDAERCEERSLAVSDLPSLSPPKNANGVLWIGVTGLSEPEVLRAIGERFGIHPLALEDVLNVPQRPKMEWYGERLLVILWEVHPPKPSEQIALFASEGLVISFRESAGDSFEPVRDRIRKSLGRIRSEGADHLLYALCDAILDTFFPLLERLGDQMEELEERLIASPRAEIFREIRELKRKLILLRHALWPARDAMNLLMIDEQPLIRPATRVFLRDCYDHTGQLIDMVNTYRELAGGLVDEYMSAVSNRMNEIIKLLTIISAFFIPLTFIVGLYGMNFDPDASPFNMPELRWRFGYPIVLALMAGIALWMYFFFRRKKWF